MLAESGMEMVTGSILLIPMAHHVKIHLGELKAGKEIAVDQAGVYADFVGENERLLEGGVPKDHLAPKIRGGGDEPPRIQ